MLRTMTVESHATLNVVDFPDSHVALLAYTPVVEFVVALYNMVAQLLVHAGVYAVLVCY